MSPSNVIWVVVMAKKRSALLSSQHCFHHLEEMDTVWERWYYPSTGIFRQCLPLVGLLGVQSIAIQQLQSSTRYRFPCVAGTELSESVIPLWKPVPLASYAALSPASISVSEGGLERETNSWQTVHPPGFFVVPTSSVLKHLRYAIMDFSIGGAIKAYLREDWQKSFLMY